SASGISSNGCGSNMPMLFTSTSACGNAAITLAQPAAVLRSAATPSTWASETVLRNLASAVSTRAGVRPLMITWAPSRASASAAANPIPAVEPVTRASVALSPRLIGEQLQHPTRGRVLGARDQARLRRRLLADHPVVVEASAEDDLFIARITDIAPDRLCGPKVEHRALNGAQLSGGDESPV